ncbi:unnamed protein product, partial [Ectocarpus sp. 12 AP-2014]
GLRATFLGSGCLACAFLLPCFIASQGKYKEAEPLYQQALAIDERLRGPDNPEAATDLYN